MICGNTIPRAALLLEDEYVVIAGHVCCCYLDDVGMCQLAKHLKLVLCMGVVSLNGEELGGIDLLCGVVLTLSKHTELTSGWCGVGVEGMM